MDINLKYSSSEIDEPSPYNILQTPYQQSPNHIRKIKRNNNNSFTSLITNLSKSFNNFYEKTMKIYQEINNNNLTLSNQILFIQYLLSVIRNKISINVDINNEIDKLSNHLEKMNYNKNSIDKNILIINNICINYHNSFQKIIKKINNINFRKAYESMERSRNSSLEINKLNNDNHIVNLKNNNYYNSCKTSIDRDNISISNYRYLNRNSNILNSFEKNKTKRLSYDDYNTSNNKKIRNSAGRTNYSIYTSKKSLEKNNNLNGNKNFQFYKVKQDVINPYKINKNYQNIYYNKERINNQSNLNIRCSSVSNIVPNISNIINNFYNRDTYCIKNENNNKNIYKNIDNNSNINNTNKTNHKKLEIELALKVISFIKLMDKIKKDVMNNNSTSNESNQNLNKLKYYIYYLSKNIIKKYNKNNIDNREKENLNKININNDNIINKKYEKLLIEFKKNMDKLHNIENENNKIKIKYKELNKNFNALHQKYNDLLKINENINKNKSPKKQKQIINRNKNYDDELPLSKKLTDITKLSHQNSTYLLEMNKLKKEKDSLLEKLKEKDNYFKSLMINNKIKNANISKKEKDTIKINKKPNLNLVISKNSFNIKNLKSKNSNNKEISSFYNSIKSKEDNIEKLNKEINLINDNNLKLKEEITQKNNEIESMNKKINELNNINNNYELKIKELIDEQKNNEKINKEKIENLINNNKELKIENDK